MEFKRFSSAFFLESERWQVLLYRARMCSGEILPLDKIVRSEKAKTLKRHSMHVRLTAQPVAVLGFRRFLSRKPVSKYNIVHANQLPQMEDVIWRRNVRKDTLSMLALASDAQPCMRTAKRVILLFWYESHRSFRTFSHDLAFVYEAV